MEMRRVKNIAHPLRPNAWHIAAPSRGALRTPSKTVIAESTRPARLTATTTATMERSPAQVPPPSPLRSRFRSCDFARFAPPCGPPHNPPWPPHGAALVHIGGLPDEHAHLPSFSSSRGKLPRVWTWSSPLCTCAGGGQPTLTLNPNPRTLTLNPTPYTQHPTSYIPHPTCRTLHPAPCTPQMTPHTPHPTPHTPHLTPHNPHPTPFIQHTHPETTCNRVVVPTCPDIRATLVTLLACGVAIYAGIGLTDPPRHPWLLSGHALQVPRTSSGQGSSAC